MSLSSSKREKEFSSLQEFILARQELLLWWRELLTFSSLTLQKHRSWETSLFSKSSQCLTRMVWFTETTGAHWLAATWIEDGKIPLLFTTQPSIMLKNCDYNLQQKESCYFTVTCMATAGVKMCSCMETQIKKFKRRSNYFRSLCQKFLNHFDTDTENLKFKDIKNQQLELQCGKRCLLITYIH